MAAALALAGCSSGGADRSRATPATSSTAGSSVTIGSTTTTTTSIPTTVRPTTTAAAKPPVSRLQAVVDAAASGRQVSVSATALDVTTGERGEHLGRRIVLSASLYKLFVAH